MYRNHLYSNEFLAVRIAVLHAVRSAITATAERLVLVDVSGVCFVSNRLYFHDPSIFYLTVA